MSRSFRYATITRSSSLDGRPVEVQVKVIRCCGDEVWCDSFTNTCPTCHTDFNSAGQELAPRWQWGEETGEDYRDLLVGDDTLADGLDG